MYEKLGYGRRFSRRTPHKTLMMLNGTTSDVMKFFNSENTSFSSSTRITGAVAFDVPTIRQAFQISRMKSSKCKVNFD